MMKPTEKEMKTIEEVISNLLELGLRDALKYKKESEVDYYCLQFHSWCDRNSEALESMGISCCSGSTKACIYSDDIDNWVIKASFDRATDPHYVKGNQVIDFCKVEAENYKAAYDYGVGCFFAPTYIVKELDGVTICIQQRVEVDPDYYEDRFRNYYIEVYDIDEEEDECGDYDLDLDVEEEVDAVFGGQVDCELFDKLLAFIDNHDINDLHEENYGKVRGVDGEHDVIIDFSGYSC